MCWSEALIWVVETLRLFVSGAICKPAKQENSHFFSIFWLAIIKFLFMHKASSLLMIKRLSHKTLDQIDVFTALIWGKPINLFWHSDDFTRMT